MDGILNWHDVVLLITNGVIMINNNNIIKKLTNKISSFICYCIVSLRRKMINFSLNHRGIRTEVREQKNVMTTFYQMSWPLTIIVGLLLWKGQYIAIHYFFGLYLVCFIICYMFLVVKKPELLQSEKYRIEEKIVNSQIQQQSKDNLINETNECNDNTYFPNEEEVRNDN
jgi:hypothetical protein